MKTTSLTTFLFTILVTLVATSCSQGPIVKGSKNYISKEVKVDNFNAIELKGSSNIVYRQDSRTHVEIHGSDNIIPLIETKVEGGTLVIKFKKNVSIVSAGKLEIKISSPDLNKLTINGSGNVLFMNGINTDNNIELAINGSGDIAGEKFNCRNMELAIRGSGNIKLQQINSEDFSASIAGSGDITLSGKTNEARYHIAGSGDIRATDLEATNVNASTAGSGNISCFVNGKLSGGVSGSGDIAYKGNPQTIDFPKKHLRKLD